MAKHVGIGADFRRTAAIGGREHITACHLKALVEDGLKNDFGGVAPDDIVARVAVEPGKLGEREHGVDVEFVKHERRRLALDGREFFQGHVAQGAAVIGEANLDEIVFERGDAGVGVGAGGGGETRGGTAGGKRRGL